MQMEHEHKRKLAPKLKLKLNLKNNLIGGSIEAKSDILFNW